MNIIETIRAEIERLKEKYTNMMPSIQKCSVCDELLSFLDTIQEQPVCEEFSKEFDEYFLPKNREQKGRWGFADIFSLARHFYELGRKEEKGQMMKEAVEGRVCAVYPLKDGNDVQYGVLYPKGVLPHKDGQKVKLIIIKED